MVETLLVRSIAPAQEWRFNLWPAVVYACPRFIFFVIFSAALVFVFGGVFSGVFFPAAFGQEPGKPTPPLSSSEKGSEARAGDRPYLRDDLNWNWNQRGRSVPGSGIGGGAAVSGLSTEDGYAGAARGCECGFNAFDCSVLLTRHSLRLRVQPCGLLLDRLRWLPMLRAMGCRITTGSRDAPLRW